MKSIRSHKWLYVFTAFLMVMMCLIGSLPQGSMITAKAISVDYPAQLMRISTADNARNLNITGTKDKSACNTWTMNGEQNENWRFDRVGADSNGTFFKIVNMGSGRLLTPMGYNVAEGTEAVIYGSESAKSQHWYVIPVSTDRLGNNLHYKIVNYENTNLALTYNASANTITLGTYSGADSQKWLLNPTGLQGFAGYCKDDNTGKVKAADIGGLFGETVEVSTFDDLKKYATSDTPYTIVVNKNISVTELNMNGSRYMCTAGRIYVHNNKTIIGSYGAHTLFNVQFCTSSNSGTGNNIIIKNFDMQHDAESNNNDSIVCYFGSGENIWVDHVTFTGHNNYGYAPQTGQVDEDKFLACCYDADYCTVSDCSFGAHKYGLILGYPSDGQNEYNNYNGYPRMSIISNKFNDTNTRGPGLMRWGYFHSLNNYVNKFSMAYTVISDCDIYAENCVYENGGNVICDWDKMTYIGYYTETGSIFSGCKRTQQGGDSNSTAGASSWRPNKNYDYKSITAENAKNYCSSYTGVQNSGSNYNYLTSASAGVPSAGYVELPTEDMAGKIGAVLDTACTYRFRNYGSGYTLEVAGGTAENGTNVQQGNTGADLWTLADAGDGYYRIYSEVGDGRTFLLDLDYGKVENGTNIGIWGDTAADAQLFKFVDNGDGTYAIVTKPTKDESGIGIEAGSTEAGANAIQWAYDGSDNQKWIIERVIGSTPLMQEIGVQDSEHFASWQTDDAAAVGDTVFGDRDFTITAMPEWLTGEMIRTSCDGKTWGGTQAVFTAGADINVYVAMDSRVDPIPAWLADWTKTSDTVTSSNDVTFVLYEKAFSQGETVNLGTNGQSTYCVNYTVFAVGQESEPEITEPAVTLYAGDVTLDGVVDGFDLAAQKRGLLKGFAGSYAEECADVNGDGSVNVTDVITLTQFLLGREVTLKLPA